MDAHSQAGHSQPGWTLPTQLDTPSPYTDTHIQPFSTQNLPSATAGAAKLPLCRPRANQPISKGLPSAPGQEHRAPIPRCFIKAALLELLEQPRAALPAEGFAPGSGDPTCAPSWLSRSSTHFKTRAGLAFSAGSAAPGGTRSLSPPSRLPFSFLTFLASLLKQLNSLEGFFSSPLLLCGSRCNLP